MSDNVVEFPQPDKIPVNLPDIGCLKIIPCLMCEHKSFGLLGSIESGIVEVVCGGCGNRLPLANSTFLTFPSEPSA